MESQKQAKKEGSVIIVAGASGVKPTRVLSKFNDYLERRNKSPVEVVDLEDLLVKHALDDGVCKASSTFQKELETDQPIIAVMTLPYPLLKRLWEDATREACSQVEKATGNGQDAALVLHAVYFKPDSTEFVPIVDARSLQKVKPRCVIHLIDDIYDVYEWLKGPDGVFNHTTYPEDKLQQAQRCIRDLVTTLVWRQAEAGASAHLAGLLGNIPLYTIASKHRCRLLERVFGTQVCAAYLSHSISEARRQATAGEQKLFDQWSTEVATLADHLSRKLEVWEPTTIDELRFLVTKVSTPGEDDGASDEMTLYFPRLLARWPYGNADEILWAHPPQQTENPIDPAGLFTDEDIRKAQTAKTWNEVENALDPDRGARLRSISGQIAQLASLISVQINARDRTLVGQCPNIVIYRPVFNGNMATGVLRELQAHRRLAELGHYGCGQQAKVFLLETSGDESLIWRKAISELCAPSGGWSRFIRENDGSEIAIEKADEIAGFVTKNGLDAARIVKKIRTGSKTLRFHWGEPKPSVLDGVDKGQGWADFEADRIRELETEISSRMRYKDVLSAYKPGQVFRFQDIGAIDFADQVIKALIEKEG